MLEILNCVDSSGGTFPDSGPGPITLKFGDVNLGFFGEVTQTELFTPAEISASLQGLATSTKINPNSVWLKFAYKGKFLFIAKQPMFANLSWEALYSYGVIYGADENGAYPFGPPTNQLLIITKDRTRFKIRTITSDSKDPSAIVIGSEDTALRSSEFTDLLYRVSVEKPAAYEGTFARYTNAELGVVTGFAEIVKESAAANVNNCLFRAWTNAPRLTHVTWEMKSTLRTYMQWRPVLEVLPRDAIFSLRNTMLSVYGQLSGAANTTHEPMSSNGDIQRVSAVLASSEGALTIASNVEVNAVANSDMTHLKNSLVISEGFLKSVAKTTFTVTN